MAFVKFPGLPGRVYVPDVPPGKKNKHPCRDCFSCEFCSDDRCRVCRMGQGNQDCHGNPDCVIGSDDKRKEGSGTS